METCLVHSRKRSLGALILSSPCVSYTSLIYFHVAECPRRRSAPSCLGNSPPHPSYVYWFHSCHIVFTASCSFLVPVVSTRTCSHSECSTGRCGLAINCSAKIGSLGSSLRSSVGRRRTVVRHQYCLWCLWSGNQRLFPGIIHRRFTMDSGDMSGVSRHNFVILGIFTHSMIPPRLETFYRPLPRPHQQHLEQYLHCSRHQISF
jgi:hypothetical protein